MELTDDHIDYITKDLHHRGIISEEVSDELIDHVCSAVEKEMKEGKRFLDAYHDALRSFGHSAGLRQTQNQVIRSGNQKTISMLTNYLTIAWRNFRKHSFYSFINVAGLAVGIASCLIIVLFIADELSYDTYNTKAHRIYRVNAEVKFGGNHFRMTYRSAPEAHTLMQDYPEIESTVRFRLAGSYLVRPDTLTENSKENYVTWTDSTFFKVFSVRVLEGNPDKALAEPASIAISKRVADKYFPGISALGKTLTLDNKYRAKVTAVYENIPAQSHFHFDILFSMVGSWPIAKEAQSTSFMSENFNTYLLLKEGADAKALEAKLPFFLEKYMGPEVAKALGEKDFSLKKLKQSGNLYETTLMPITDIHLHSNIRGDFEPNSNITYVYLFGTIALFILIIACINFMNLSTARSSNRAKEVGIRKVMGSLRFHLVRQFLTESVLVTLIAFVLSLILAWVLIPVFNDLSSKQLSLPTHNPIFYLIFTGMALLVGVMAGLYPSFFLSAFRPVKVLKGNVALGMKSGFIRSALVVFQFVISIFLIIGAITVNQQLNFIQSKSLGFEKDQVIIIHDGYALRPGGGARPFKDEVLRQSSIESGTISGFIPVDNDWVWRNNSSFWREGTQPTTESMVGFQRWSADYDYVKTFRMKIKKGRDFSRDFSSDSSGVILNETAVKRLGLGDDPIGKKVNTFAGGEQPDPNVTSTWTVVGVVEDFHFSSMKENISALGIFIGRSDGSVSFRFKPSKANEVVASIEKIWKQLAPGQPFQYSFLDDDFEQMYLAEQRLGKIFIVFAALAIVIACLGLFALTAFSVEQRTKEIGIRKVLGASVKSIVLLLSKDFGKLILIAFVLSAPIAWFAIDWWLQSYTYKTTIGPYVYLIAGVLALTIALLTMAYQSVRAANSDPVKSLRNE